MTARPFKVLGVEQIAIGGLDLDALRELWVDARSSPHLKYGGSIVVQRIVQ